MNAHLNGWQIGNRILVALILAALWFGAGILWERKHCAPRPVLQFRTTEIVRGAGGDVFQL